MYEQVTISELAVGKTYTGWDFYNVPWPSDLFTKRVLGLSESGLTELWKRWSFRAKTWNGTSADARRPRRSVKPTSLERNYVTIFYVLLTFSSICVSAFMFENRKAALWLIGKFINVCFKLTIRFKYCKTR